jgi:V/A-type H+/Na+-transporting ATPase subunit E
MSLERLIEEIRLRAERELEDQRKLGDAQEKAILDEREQKVRQLVDDGQRLAEADATRERAQKLASAKLQARKLVYETRERQTAQALTTVRAALLEYTEDPEYPAALKRMVAFATDRLGKQLHITGRAEDAAALRTAAGKNFDPDHPVPMIGGLIAETPDGNRRLNLSFDELLRLRDDEVRSLLP